MNQAYAKEILSNLKKRLFVPDKYINCFLQGNQKDVIKTLEQGVLSNDDDISIVYADVLSKSAPDRAALLIPQRIKDSNDSVKDQMIKILQSIESTNSRDSLIEILGSGDIHLDATILKTLFHSRNPDEKYRVEALLDNSEPRMKAAGIYGVLRYPIQELSEKAITEWGDMLKSDDESSYIPAVDLLTTDFKTIYLQPPLRQIVQQRIRKLLRHDDKYCNKVGLNILSTWPTGSFENIEDEILSLSTNDDCDIREACINTIALLSTAEREKLLSNALEDQHPNVRDNAIKTLSSTEPDDIEYVKQLLTSKYMRSPRSIQTMLKYLMAAGTDASTMQSISLFLADEARKLKNACHFIKDMDRSNSQEMTLLTLTLKERIIDITDLSLYAIQASNHEEDIAVIRAGLNSKDKRQFSNAYELLTMLNNKKLAKLILPLFDESMSSNKTGNNNSPFKNINELTRWLQDRSDPWLKECASYYSATLDNKSYV
jgi:HEAT repeat protein